MISRAASTSMPSLTFTSIFAVPFGALLDLADVEEAERRPCA